MTDRKKKPEEDEVGDEQLEDVAGGITAASASTGGAMLAFPDVCKTPAAPSPIPTPYPNVGSTGDSSTKKVKLDGDPVEPKGDG
jgi:hypothetical protein